MTFIVEPVSDEEFEKMASKHRTLCALCAENPRFCGPGGDDWAK